MGTAAEAVLDTVELLESILHSLPTEDLLFAQKVCKQWRGVIVTSPKLQRALFFTPVDLELLTFNRSITDGTWRWTTKRRENYTVFANPLLRRVRRAMDLTHGAPMTNMPVSWLRSEASWKQMLLTQPAVEFTYKSDPRRLRSLEPIIFNAKEMRAGRIVRRLNRWYRRYRVAHSFADVEGDEKWEKLRNNEQLEQMYPKTATELEIYTKARVLRSSRRKDYNEVDWMGELQDD